MILHPERRNTVLPSGLDTTRSNRRARGPQSRSKSTTVGLQRDRYLTSGNIQNPDVCSPSVRQHNAGSMTYNSKWVSVEVFQRHCAYLPTFPLKSSNGNFMSTSVQHPVIECTESISAFTHANSKNLHYHYNKSVPIMDDLFFKSV